MQQSNFLDAPYPQATRTVYLAASIPPTPENTFVV